jgi:energy-coupling factor transport system permease protein
LADVHPLIRVVTLLIFIAGLAFARPLFLVAGIGLLLVLNILVGFPAPGRLLQMVSRLRWLFLAILLVYGWWTPGVELFPAMGSWSPTSEGIFTGLLRVLSLVLIVAAAMNYCPPSCKPSDLLPRKLQGLALLCVSC